MRITPTLALLTLGTTSLLAQQSLTVDATYRGRIVGLPNDRGAVTVYIPLPTSTPHQTVSNVQIAASGIKWIRATEKEFGNEYAYAVLERPPAELDVNVTFRVTRDEVRLNRSVLAKGTPSQLQRNLQPDRLVTISPKVRTLSAEVTNGKSGAVAKSRAIYDHLLATMQYDKTEPGWGKGDSERACDIRKGNCTDFHSLFISLARAQNVPARFVIGYPLTAADGLVTGYHCWAEFYVEGKGWVPVDPSDASKTDDQKTREYLFGNLDANRFEMTRGRDLELTPPTAEPLNYFLHPYAEVDGLEAGNATSSLSFKRVNISTAASRQK